MMVGGKTRVPFPGEINFVLYASGNPSCPAQWTPEDPSPEYNTCGDTETWPPGGHYSEEEIQRFVEYVQDTKDVLNNSLMTWNPYTVKGVLADSISIQDYIESVDNIGLATLKTPNTYVAIRTDSSPYRALPQISISTNGIEYMFGASATAKGNLKWLYSTENNLWGAFEQPGEDVCSVHDFNDDGMLCPPSPDDCAYTAFDENKMAVIAQ